MGAQIITRYKHRFMDDTKLCNYANWFADNEPENPEHEEVKEEMRRRNTEAVYKGRSPKFQIAEKTP